MEIRHQATRLNLFDVTTPPMRAFHMAWCAFFLSFFGWFGMAPLMAIVREDLLLTKAQIGTTIVASVAMPVLVRLLIGPLCERYGARLTYIWLLLLGALPVMGIGLATSYETFLLFRLAIGTLGASFVITQYHTSVMFAPNCVGTANAAAAGWGNLGGGVTQVVMPLMVAAFVSVGVNPSWGWRLAMIPPGIVLWLTALAYAQLTQDAPEGNYQQLRAAGKLPPLTEKAHGSLLLAAQDGRVWALCGMYAACFGMEITMHNIAALYYHDRFGLDVTTAGLIAGLFGLMNLFARALGGILQFGGRVIGNPAAFAIGQGLQRVAGPATPRAPAPAAPAGDRPAADVVGKAEAAIGPDGYALQASRGTADLAAGVGSVQTVRGERSFSFEPFAFADGTAAGDGTAPEGGGGQRAF